MDFEVPANVEIHKQAIPGGWSYPLKTSEIVTALDLGDLDKKIDIFYMNDRPGPTLPRNQKKYRSEGWFNIFSITWYGHMRKSEMHFFMGVHLCKPKYRQRLNKIITEEVFPVIKPWMKDVGRLPNINSISLDYHTFFPKPGVYQKLEWGLELRENKDHRKWFKVIDLDKKEGEDEGAEGTVLAT
jgi:hypothetical protein